MQEVSESERLKKEVFTNVRCEKVRASGSFTVKCAVLAGAFYENEVSESVRHLYKYAPMKNKS